MADLLTMDQLRSLAAHGARARVAELQAEIAAILRVFPGVARAVASPAAPAVRRRRRRGRRRKAVAIAVAKSGVRKKGQLSEAGRAAIAAAQRRRWAAVRRKKAAAGS